MSDKKSIGRGLLASFLRHRRIVMGMSQHNVAQHLGYGSAQFVSNWERAISSPPGNMLPKLAELYKVPEEELLSILLKDQETLIRTFFRDHTKHKNASEMARVY